MRVDLSDRLGVRWYKSLPTRLCWLTISVVVITLLTVGSGLTWIAYRAQRESVYRLQEQSAEKVTLLISNYVLRAIDGLHLLESMQPLASESVETQKIALEKLLLNRTHIYSQITLIDANGTEQAKVSRFHTFLPTELVSLHHTPAFQRAQKGEIYVSSVYLSEASGLLSVQIALPVGNGAKKGVLSAEINISPLWQDIAAVQVGQTGYVYLVDQTGHFVAYQDPVTILQRYGEDMQLIPPIANYISTGGKDRNRVFEYEGLRREPVVGLQKSIPGTPWIAIVELPTKEAFAIVDRMILYLLGLALIGVLVAGRVVFIVSERLVRPVRTLSLAAQRIGSGDLDVVIIPPQREDEVSVFAKLFRQMQLELKRLYHNLETQLSDLQQAQSALQQSEAYYRTIVETTADGIWFIDSDTKTTFVNQQMAAMLGYTIHEMHHRSILEFMDDTDQAMLSQRLKECQNRPQEQADQHFRRKDGSDFWGIFSAKPLSDSEGNVTGTFAMVTDITQRKCEEEEARRLAMESADFQKTLLDLSKMDKTDLSSALSAILSADAEMLNVERVSYWSVSDDLLTLQCQMLYTRSRATFGPEQEMEMLHQHDCPRFFRALSEQKLIVVTDVTADIRTSELAPNYMREHDITSTLDVTIWLQGRFVGVVCHEHVGSKRVWNDREQTFTQSIGEMVSISIEASERRRMEGEKERLEEHLRQARKMEAIGQLAGGIAHDFNNILTALVGFSNLLQLEMPEEDPLRSYVTEIFNASTRAASLTKGLLAFSRKQTMELKPLNVNTVVTEMRNLLKRLVSEDIEFRTNLYDQPLVVMADQTHLDQILLNLVTNARDAMPQGGKLTIETQRIDCDAAFISAHGFGTPGPYATIVVTDTGIGMDPNTRDRIFEPFFTTKGIGHGTGLGLSTVYGIVQQHQGYINVYSEPNIGTAFHIFLPLAASDEKKPFHRPNSVREGYETILIAEDDDSSRKLLATVLRKGGYRVIEAQNGEVAIQQFLSAQDEIAMIILDVVMPKKNGVETLNELRAYRKNLKVLFTSGYTGDLVFDKGISEGDFNFMSKPFSPFLLLEKVRDILDETNVATGKPITPDHC